MTHRTLLYKGVLALILVAIAGGCCNSKCESCCSDEAPLVLPDPLRQPPPHDQYRRLDEGHRTALPPID